MIAQGKLKDLKEDSLHKDTRKSMVLTDETFSPVARYSSIHTLLALAVEKKIQIHQMDVGTAFLWRSKGRHLRICNNPQDTSIASNLDNWPDIEYPNIYNYIISTPSLYTKDMLTKVWKATTTSFLVCLYAWSIYMYLKETILIGKARHIQNLSETPLQPWIAVEKSGSVLCAHCTCKAGLGEACSHIAAILAEAQTQVKKNISCTSHPCKWLPPSRQKCWLFSNCWHWLFQPRTKRKRMMEERSSQQPHSATLVVPIPSESDLEHLYKELWNHGKPALLSIVPQYCDRYVSHQTWSDRWPFTAISIQVL